MSYLISSSSSVVERLSVHLQAMDIIHLPTCSLSHSKRWLEGSSQAMKPDPQHSRVSVTTIKPKYLFYYLTSCQSLQTISFYFRRRLLLLETTNSFACSKDSNQRFLATGFLLARSVFFTRGTTSQRLGSISFTFFFFLFFSCRD